MTDLDFVLSFSRARYHSPRTREDRVGTNASTKYVSRFPGSAGLLLLHSVRKFIQSPGINTGVKTLTFPGRMATFAVCNLKENTFSRLQVRRSLAAAGVRQCSNPRRRIDYRRHWSLVLVLLRSGYTHALKTCASGVWAGDSAGRATTACAGHDLLPSDKHRAQVPRNTTSHVLQGADTVTRRGCWPTLCGGDRL